MIEKLINDNILLEHNFNPYIKVKEYYNDYQKFCIVHATGTGKSYITIQLIKDILEEKPNAKFLYVVPRKRIKSQIIYDIEHLQLDAKIRDKIKNSIDFETYGSLTNKNIEELKQYDMAIVDEFQHIGAEIWSKKIEQMRDANIKIFGLSATPVRYEYTSHPINVAESFFDNNVASYYDVVDAMADSVLPIPEYHASIIKLIGDCEYLKNNVENGTASNEEKVQFYRMYANIQARIKEKNLMPKDILKKNLKKDGKYIYFVSNINDLERAKKEFLESLTEEERQNIEIYEVYSGYSNKVNNKNHENFLHNISNDGKSAKGKMRVMFSIDMYTEGVHIPDLNGVILGRSTQSDRVFNQQIGRALAVSPDKKDKNYHPLIIDLAGNINGIMNIYRKLKGKLNENKSLNNSKINYLEDINLEYYLTEELIDVINLFEEMKKYKKNIIIVDIKTKIYEFIEYVNKGGSLSKEKGQTINKTENIENVITFWQSNKDKIYRTIIINENKEKYPVAYERITKKYEDIIKRKEDTPEKKLIEYIEYIDKYGDNKGTEYIGLQIIENIKYRHYYWQRNSKRIISFIEKEENKTKYPNAYLEIQKKIKERIEKNTNKITLEDKIIEFIEHINKKGYIASNNIKEIESTKNIKNVKLFWNEYREKIYEEIQKNEIRAKYPISYIIVIVSYKNYLIKNLSRANKWDNKKRTDNIKFICKTYRINYEKNINILNHISFKELITKIKYLESLNIPICNENEIMNEIFSTSSINFETIVKQNTANQTNEEDKKNPSK